MKLNLIGPTRRAAATARNIGLVTGESSNWIVKKSTFFDTYGKLVSRTMDFSQISVNELAQICAHSAQADEWQEFLRRTAPLAALISVRVARIWSFAPTPTLIEDIVQEVFLKLCEHDRRVLREFRPRGEDSFLALLRIVATSVANDYFRRQHSAKRGGRVLTLALAGESGDNFAPENSDLASLQNSVLYAQLDRRMRLSMGAVSERDRSLFWLYYRQGFTAEEIAALPAVGLTAKGVESALRRVSRWLRVEVEGSIGQLRVPLPLRPAAGLGEGEFGSFPLNRDEG